VNVRLTHIDGKLPNLALMKLAHYHREQGDEVVLSRNVHPDMFEPKYDRVYGSAIFTRSLPLVERFRAEFPEGIVGGTGTADWTTVEQYLGVDDFEKYDYSVYPDFENSIGFTMRGCRLACGFCVVPRKEGKPRNVSTIADIWRGDPYPKNLLLLDNDFFGQPREQWEARVQEIIDGGFKVSFNQGINVRLIFKESAEALARLPYFDDSFKSRTLYTAYDNFKDEGIFRRGVSMLLEAGIPPSHLMVYMLVGYDPSETWERLFHRFDVMIEMGVRPYPMVYQRVGESRSGNDLDFRDLRMFQRWVIRRYYKFIPWPDYVAGRGTDELYEQAKELDRRDSWENPDVDTAPGLFDP
jgi:hypothetical protein